MPNQAHDLPRLEGDFKESDGKIVIRTWTDPDGSNWFRITDDLFVTDDDFS